MTCLQPVARGWRVKSRKKGQSLVEYALILGLASIVALASLEALGDTGRGLLELVHTAAVGGGDPANGCTGMNCGSGTSCALTCRCTPNRPHCHNASCN
jgi:hypothetical protein